MAFSVLPFIMWAAIRFGVGVTALSILMVAAIATIETALGSGPFARDRKSTRLNSSHGYISYAVFCLKKKKNIATFEYHTQTDTQPILSELTRLPFTYSTHELSFNSTFMHVLHKPRGIEITTTLSLTV